MPYFTFSPSEKLVGRKVAKVEKDGDWITLTFDNGARALVIRLSNEEEWEECEEIAKSASAS